MVYTQKAVLISERVFWCLLKRAQGSIENEWEAELSFGLPTAMSILLHKLLLHKLSYISSL